MEKFKQFYRGLNNSQEQMFYEFIRATAENYLDQNVKNIDSAFRGSQIAADIIDNLKEKPAEPPTQEEQILTLIDEFSEAAKMAVELGKAKDSITGEIERAAFDFKNAAASILSKDPILKAC